MFLSGAVNMTEPEVKAYIAGFINSHLNVDYAKSVASLMCKGLYHNVHACAGSWKDSLTLW